MLHRNGVPLYQLLGTNLRSSVGAGLAGETLGKVGGSDVGEDSSSRRHASFFSKPENSQRERERKKKRKKKKNPKDLEVKTSKHDKTGFFFLKNQEC